MKIQLFQNMVKFLIKLNGIANAATFPHTDPPPFLGLGSKGQNPTIQNMVMLHIKRERCMQRHGPIPWVDLGGGAEAEYGHVEHQIKWNHECGCTMVANILPAKPPSPTLGGQIQLFQNRVMLHIKLNGNMQAHILSLHVDRSFLIRWCLLVGRCSYVMNTFWGHFKFVFRS